MRVKKIISVLAAVMLGASVLTGCGSKEASEGKTKLRFATWDSEKDLTVQEELVKKFNSENEDIEVVLEAYGSEFDTKLAAGIGAGDTPDVMYMWNYPLYADILEPLDERIENEGASYKEKFFDTLWNYNTYDENVYGIPVGYTTHVVYYNKELFDKAGVDYPTGDWTFNELREVAEKLTNKEEKIYGFAFSTKPDPYDFEMNLWNNDVSYTGDDNKLSENINSEKSVEVYKTYQNMIKDEIALPTEGVGADEMKSGKIAMFINGSWSINTLKDQGIDFGVTVLPTIKKGEKSKSIVSASGIAMSKESKNKDAAWKFIKYWTSEKANKERVSYELPVIKSVADSEKLLDDNIYSIFYQMLEQSGEETPTSFKVENWTEISEKISNANETIFNPTTLTDPKTALDNVTK